MPTCNRSLVVGAELEIVVTLTSESLTSRNRTWYKEATMTHETVQEQVIARGMKDSAFRQALLNNPRAVLAREYHVHLHDHLTVRVLEDTPHTFTLVLPAREET